MMQVLVAPNLLLDEEMYELAKIELGLVAPEQVEAFTWARFVQRESWILVPDVEHPELPWYKAEFVIKLEPPYEQTIKLNVWWAHDLRKTGQPTPHSHPWPFRGRVFMGGYVEDRYATSNPAVLDDPYNPCDLSGFDFEPGIVHAAGTVNDIPLHTFHEVTEVLEPGRTLSLMDCSMGRQNGWGYLDPDTGLYIPNKQSPTDARFTELYLDRNPHKRR